MTNEERIARLERVLGTLMVWGAQTSGWPLCHHSTEELLKMLKEKPRAK